MQANYYEVTKNATIESVDTPSFNAKAHDKESMFLVTIMQSDPAELERFLEGLGVSETAIYSALNPRNISVVFPFEHEVYFEFSVCVDEDDGPREQYIAFLALQNLVICLNASTVMTKDRLLAVSKQLKLTNGSMPSLLSALLARETLLVSKKVIDLRTTLYNMDEQMDRDAESVEISDIHDQKQLLRVYDMVNSSQLSCLNMLESLSTKLVALIEDPMYFKLASTTVTNTSQVMLRLDKTTTDLSLRYDSNAQDKMNHRLGVLTILSVIFMPITFLAGIFGMNFDKMPGLHFTWGYPIALSVMSAIAIGLYFYFKNDGWLD